MKKIVLFLIILLGVIGTSAINVPKLKAVPTYEVKSEVINFDYTKMAYPYPDAKIGGDFAVKDTIVAPKKLEPGKPVDTRDVNFNSFLDGFFIVIGLFMLCVLVVLIMLIIDTFLPKPHRN